MNDNPLNPAPDCIGMYHLSSIDMSLLWSERLRVSVSSDADIMICRLAIRPRNGLGSLLFGN